MKSRLISLVAALALVVVPSAGAGTAFFVRGGGWGHGIGMSQWGAYGQALNGRSYDTILAHYYRGTALGEISNVSLGVILASGRSSLTIGSNARFTVTGAGGKTWTLGARDHTFGPDLRLRTVSGRWVTLSSPASFRPGNAKLRLNGSYYRGSFGVASNGTSLSAVNHLSMESYLRGVVARESPASWPLEALKAQAVAARSYAYVSIQGGRYLYPDTRDQVYGGVAAETGATDRAVSDTRRQVVTYNGSVVQAFFFSSSGGRTASIADEWGSSPVPYLVSVKDPWDRYSPYHRWGSFRYTTRGIASHVTVPRGFNDMVVNRNGSGRAASVDLIGSSTRRVTGSSFRSAFNLRSTRFWISVLRLSASHPKTRPCKGAVRLSGFERREKPGLGVQQRLVGGAWQTAASGINPNPDGTFVVCANPTATTFYRPVSSHGAGKTIRVDPS